MLLNEFAAAEMSGDLSRREGENPPSRFGWDRDRSQNIIQKLLIRFGVLAVEKKMSARNHKHSLSWRVGAVWQHTTPPTSTSTIV
jgi:hypothetical protein